MRWSWPLAEVNLVWRNRRSRVIPFWERLSKASPHQGFLVMDQLIRRVDGRKARRHGPLHQLFVACFFHAVPYMKEGIKTLLSAVNVIGKPPHFVLIH